MKSFVHTNYPIQVCSLTTGRIGSWPTVCRSVVTKSREGNACQSHDGLWPVPKTLAGNGEQQLAGHLKERQIGGLAVSQSGKAKQQVVGKRTSVGIVKVSHQILLTEMARDRVEHPFYVRRPQSAGKKMDMCTCGVPGVKGGDMLGKRTNATGESPCDHREDGVSRSIRRKAESWSEVSWEVGDAHTSGDVLSTETACSEGALACQCFCSNGGGRR